MSQISEIMETLLRMPRISDRNKDKKKRNAKIYG